MPMEPATSKKFAAFQERQAQEGYARFIKIDVTQYDEGHYLILRNRWWWCIDGKPEMACFYRTNNAPQCNVDCTIASGFPHHPDAELVFVPLGFIKLEGEQHV